MPSRIVTLLTDFGLRDHFVAAMKGVILSIAPQTRIVDVAHELDACQIPSARFTLAQSWPYFPKGTIHVAIVDPGVGTSRRPLLVEAGGHLFVGPDNGILCELFELTKCRVRHITNKRLFRKEVSSTFHGRDVFAPVAAYLAKGLKPAQAGPLIHDALNDALRAPQRTGRRFWTGAVVSIDRFGNVITNFPSADFPDLGSRMFCLRVGGAVLVSLHETYAELSPGEPGIVRASHGFLEVAVSQASAARLLGVEPGAPVELEMP